jgi:diguanylate cyclase (GGDEF)-like protein
VLRAFAGVLLGAVRQDDAVFRMGGDEFAVLLEGCSTVRAQEVVDRIVARLEDEMGDGELSVGASFGVAVADWAEPVVADELLRRADDATYEAKGSRTTLQLAA